MPYKAANFVYGRLSQPAAAGDISISIRPTDPLTSFPNLGADDWTYGVIFAADGNPGQPEVVRINAINNNVLSVVRGVGGTVAQAWVAGDRIELRTVAQIFEDLEGDPPPIYLSQAQYFALDPVVPDQLYGIPEEEDRPIPQDTLITGPRVLRALRSLPAGGRLSALDLDGLPEAIRTVLEDDLTFSLDGGLIASCAVPAAADYTDGDAIAAVRWRVAPSQRNAWRLSAAGDMAWNLFDRLGAPRHRQGVGEDGWWVVLRVGANEIDRVHIPAGGYGFTAGGLDVELFAGPTQRLRLYAWKTAAVAGPPVVNAHVSVSVRGAGTAVQANTVVELRTYGMSVQAGG